MADLADVARAGKACFGIDGIGWAGMEAVMKIVCDASGYEFDDGRTGAADQRLMHVVEEALRMCRYDRTGLYMTQDSDAADAAAILAAIEESGTHRVVEIVAT